MSVATWSLRLRPVCRRLPASPTRAVRRFSMFRWTSSSSRFQLNSPRSISPNLGHAAFDGGQVGGADDALAGQHGGMGQGAADVLGGHALVEEHAGGVALDQIGDGFGETSGPGLGGAVLGCGVICHNY
jgi:hypothetical protein